MRKSALFVIALTLLALGTEGKISAAVQKVELVKVVPTPPLPRAVDFSTEFEDTLDHGTLTHDVTHQRVRTDFSEEGRSVLDFCQRGVRYELKKDGGLWSGCTYHNISCEVLPFSPPANAEFFRFQGDEVPQSPQGKDYPGVWRTSFLSPSSELGLLEFTSEFYWHADGTPR